MEHVSEYVRFERCSARSPFGVAVGIGEDVVAKDPCGGDDRQSGLIKLSQELI